MTDRPILFSAPMVRALIEGRKTQTRRILGPGNTLFNGRPWSVLQKAQMWDWAGAWVDAGPSPAGNPGPYLKLPWLSGDADPFEGTVHRIYPLIQPGDRLWVREAHALVPSSAYRMSEGVSQAIDPTDKDRACIYREGWVRSTGGLRWRPSIHMPRWASRITLTVTEVRVQRLAEISEDDAKAEGFTAYRFPGPWWQGYEDLGDGYLLHQQVIGDAPPDWMIEPHRMRDATHLNRTAAHAFRDLWNSLHGPGAWDENPWVAAISFRCHLGNIDQMGGGDD